MTNSKGYSVGMMEFFDYHLKGQPAPDWLRGGIAHLKPPEPLENRTF